MTKFRNAILLSCLAAASLAAQAQSTPAKKELVARILKVQQPAIEAMARQMVRQPAGELLGGALQYVETQVAADKREAMAKGLQQDAEKYVNETYPLVRDRALKLAPTTVGTVLEEKFSEDELKQIAAMLENPVFQKYQTQGGDMERALAAKLVADARTDVTPRLRALDETFAKRLGVKPIAQNAAPSAPAASGRKK